MRLVAREGAFEIVAVHLGEATSQNGRVLDKRCRSSKAAHASSDDCEGGFLPVHFS